MTSLKQTWSPQLRFLLAGLGVALLLAGVASAGPGDFFWSSDPNTPPDIRPAPPPPPPPPPPPQFWQTWPPPGGSLIVPAPDPAHGEGGVRWLGILDPLGPKPDKTKSIKIQFWGTNLNNIGFPPVVGGHSVPNPNPPPPATIPVKQQGAMKRNCPFPHTTLVYDDLFLRPQPDSEWLKLTGTAAPPVAATISRMHVWNACFKTRVNDGNKVCLYDVETAEQDTQPPNRSPFQLTEFWLWSNEADLDLNAIPTFAGPAGSGNWTYQFITQDAFGNPLLHGGVRWTTDGAGIMPGDMYSTDFMCLSGNSEYIGCDMFNAAAGDTGEYVYNGFYCPEPGSLLLFGIIVLARRR